MSTVHVPDILGPKVQLCWAQSSLMMRCDRKKDHPGPHIWEMQADLTALRQQFAGIVETALYKLLIECRDELADARDEAERMRVRLAALQSARKGVTT